MQVFLLIMVVGDALTWDNPILGARVRSGILHECIIRAAAMVSLAPAGLVLTLMILSSEQCLLEKLSHRFGRQSAYMA